MNARILFQSLLDVVAPNLTQLPDFTNLTYIGGELFIYFDNTQPGQLLNLQGLNALERVGKLNIQGNPTFEQSLESLDGLQNLDSITNGIQIEYLEHFHDFSALSPDLGFAGGLRIKNNPSLESCAESEVFCNLISQSSGFTQIS